MRIERVRIRGYRSLKDLELRPKQFTVLVGPNNSGKSNIVDALDFLSSVYASNPKLAIDQKGGFENISHRSAGVPGRQISFDVDVIARFDEIDPFSFPPPSRDPSKNQVENAAEMRLRHSFALRGEGDQLISDFVIPRETVQIDLLDENPSLVLKATRSKKKVNVVFGENDERLKSVVSPFYTEHEELVREMIQSSVSERFLVIDRLDSIVHSLYQFTRHLSHVRMYQLAPRECRIPAAPTPVADLGIHGNNLPALVYFLKNRHRDSWSQVLQHMSPIVSDLDDIDVRATHERLWTLQFNQAGGDQWTASEVSDGTIRTLGLLASIYDPRGSLLAIEEPENSVHPWILRMFVDVCREVSRPPIGKQILVTTHSPILINHLEPSEVMVVWKQASQTHLRPLTRMDSSIQRSWRTGASSLFDVLDSGLLREAVPIPES